MSTDPLSPRSPSNIDLDAPFADTADVEAQTEAIEKFWVQRLTELIASLDKSPMEQEDISEVIVNMKKLQEEALEEMRVRARKAKAKLTLIIEEGHENNDVKAGMTAATKLQRIANGLTDQMKTQEMKSAAKIKDLKERASKAERTQREATEEAEILKARLSAMRRELRELKGETVTYQNSPNRKRNSINQSTHGQIPKKAKGLQAKLYSKLKERVMKSGENKLQDSISGFNYTSDSDEDEDMRSVIDNQSISLSTSNINKRKDENGGSAPTDTLPRNTDPPQMVSQAIQCKIGVKQRSRENIPKKNTNSIGGEATTNNGDANEFGDPENSSDNNEVSTLSSLFFLLLIIRIWRKLKMNMNLKIFQSIKRTVVTYMII
jgi:hypothetical protein